MKKGYNKEIFQEVINAEAAIKTIKSSTIQDEIEP